MKPIKIIEASWHRNGISGVGFYAILFKDEDRSLKIASLFDEPGYCSVFQIDMLADENIAFAHGNSWRGDYYEYKLRPLLEVYLKEHDSNRIGPFSAIPVGEEI